MFGPGELAIFSVVLCIALLILSLFITNNKISVAVVLTGLFIIVFSFVISLIAAFNLEKLTWKCDKIPYKTQEIVSLGDSSEVNGRIYARRGYVGERLYYHYIVERPNGGFVTDKVKANDAVLYYSDDDFRVEWYKLRRKWWIFYEERENYAKIYIPEGSITDDFRVDLE